MKKTPAQQIARYKRLIAQWEEFKAEMIAENWQENIEYADTWIARYTAKLENIAKSLE